MGPVIYQLYKLDHIQWNEAASVPEGMPITTGDKICQAKRPNIITNANRQPNLSRQQRPRIKKITQQKSKIKKYLSKQSSQQDSIYQQMKHDNLINHFWTAQYPITLEGNWQLRSQLNTLGKQLYLWIMQLWHTAKPMELVRNLSYAAG